MSFLKNIFKRKPGGTFVGNLIRGAANTATGGLLGNGAMLLRPNETPAQADSRILQGIGAGLATVQDVANNANPVTVITPSGQEQPDVSKSVTTGVASYLSKTCR